jgi:hypothetical protein
MSASIDKPLEPLVFPPPLPDAVNGKVNKYYLIDNEDARTASEIYKTIFIDRLGINLIKSLKDEIIEKFKSDVNYIDYNTYLTKIINGNFIDIEFNSRDLFNHIIIFTIQKLYSFYSYLSLNNADVLINLITIIFCTHANIINPLDNNNIDKIKFDRIQSFRCLIEGYLVKFGLYAILYKQDVTIQIIVGNENALEPYKSFYNLSCFDYYKSYNTIKDRYNEDLNTKIFPFLVQMIF